MQGITVDRLYKQLGILIKKGYGNRFVAISQDDEINGIHTVWDGACTVDAETMTMIEHAPMYNEKNCILIA